MTDWSEFDRYCEKHGYGREHAPEAFAQWLADTTGNAIIGGPVGKAPTVVAIPEIKTGQRL